MFIIISLPYTHSVGTPTRYRVVWPHQIKLTSTLPGILEHVQVRRRKHLEGFGHLEAPSGGMLPGLCRQVGADHLQTLRGELALMFFQGLHLGGLGIGDVDKGIRPRGAVEGHRQRCVRRRPFIGALRCNMGETAQQGGLRCGQAGGPVIGMSLVGKPGVHHHEHIGPNLPHRPDDPVDVYKRQPPDAA